MLAPGDMLLQPVPMELRETTQVAPQRTTVDTAKPTQPAQPAPEKSEARSFLLILLRALGAIHT
ncbi:MAG: hypothetical protein L0241_12125 [Planctomycetia bacterium]|nr:hypothetical protein [Planctomycetia bacterium]